MNNYPFATKSQIKALLASSDSAVAMAVIILQDRQTSFEQATRSTKDRNHRGWMSSHAVRGGRLADEIVATGTLSADSLVLARGMVSRYSTQLASHIRAQAVEADPSLLEKSACYFGG
jgi:hypothetical protein